jgi:hypothetical protein
MLNLRVESRIDITELVERAIGSFDDTGSLGRHVVVDIESGKPNQVTLETNQADEAVRAFANTIS